MSDVDDLEGDDPTQDEPDLEGVEDLGSAKKIVLVFTGVEDGVLEGVVDAVVENAQNRGLFLWFAAWSTMDAEEVPENSALREALTGQRNLS